MIKSLIALQCKQCITLALLWSFCQYCCFMAAHNYQWFFLSQHQNNFFCYSSNWKIKKKPFMHKAQLLQSKLFYKRTLIISNRIVPVNLPIVQLWYLNLFHEIFPVVSATSSIQLWIIILFIIPMIVIYMVDLFASPTYCAEAQHIYSFNILSKNK